MTFGDKNAFLCVYVGRISKEKRIDVIVEAVRSIEGVYLAIVGEIIHKFILRTKFSIQNFHI